MVIIELCQRKFIQGIIMAGIALVVAGVSLEYLPRPYFYIFLGYALMLITAAIATNRSSLKALCWNAAVLLFSLAGAELYFYEVYFAEEPPREVEYRLIGESEKSSDRNTIIDSFDYHEILGYAYHRSPSFSETTRFKGQSLYEVTYTLDAHGLRIAPPFEGDSAIVPSCVLFFGDSFTFGEGVHDEETLPYRTGVKGQHRFQIYNFGFLGYGPHQMLAQLQHGLVREAIQCGPRYAIYQALPGHVSRAAGLEAWDQSGPKYMLDRHGAVVAKGHFNDETQRGILSSMRRTHQSLGYSVKRSLEKSAFYRALLYMRRPINDSDVTLFAGIVDQSRRILETTYPGIEFHIIFWDFSNQTDPTEVKMIEALKRSGMSLHFVSKIIPGYLLHRDRYILHHADGHPNKLAYECLADYVIDSILKREGRYLAHTATPQRTEDRRYAFPIFSGSS